VQVRESTGAPRRRAGARGPEPAYTPDEVTAAAVRLADRDGLAATTVRALAAELGVAPAGLYRYVPSRAALVERMVEAALADHVPSAGTGDPVEDLVAWTEAQVAVLRRHPWLVDTLAAVPPGPRAIDGLEAGLAALEPMRASGAAKLEALAMLTGVATLFARSAAAPAPGTAAAMAAAAASRPRLAAAFADPGTASAPEELLRRTVEALVAGLLGPR
jgi:AcrR family transcriptional regulator